MYAHLSKACALIAVTAGMVIWMTVPAYSAEFAISPVEVSIGQHQRSQLVVVTNQDNAPLRFQLQALRWDERANGPMVLTPTDDVIFFPQLFDIAPHNSQNIRVGTIAPAISGENTYRLIFHQLKSFEPPRPRGNVGRTVILDVLTNVSIPVFIEPSVATAIPGLGQLTVSNSTLSFSVTNSGNAHFKIKSLRVEGFGNAAQPVFSKTSKGWYVLAGKSRDYQLAMSSGECSQISHLDLSVDTDHGKLEGAATVNPQDCAGN